VLPAIERLVHEEKKSVYKSKSMGSWLENSMRLDLESMSVQFWACTFFLTGILAICFVQSHAYSTLYCRKGSFVRTASDCSLLSGAAMGLMMIMASIQPNPVKTTICCNVFESIFYAIIQVFDNYMFYNRLKACTKLRTWAKICITSYIWLVLVLTWVPVYTFVPCFLDTNATHFQYVYEILLLIWGWGSVGYNLLFTILFIRIIFHSQLSLAELSGRSLAARHTAVKINRISSRSIVHCITSCVVNVVATYGGQEGDLVFMTVTPLCMHFLFNYKGNEFDTTVSWMSAKIYVSQGENRVNFSEAS